MLTQLTPRQRTIYEFLSTTIRQKGYAPSIPEIGQRFKITSTRGVFDHLQALEKKGYIRRVGKRAIEIINSSGRSALPEAKEIPIVGRVRAGVPILAEENIEGFLPVASELARGEETFALKVKGDSMIEDGILEGDLVIIRRQDTANNDDIVCALIGSEATLKRFHRKGNEISLKPANKNYDPIVVSKGEFRVLGKATGVIRKL
jgi:repressor LexA